MIQYVDDLAEMLNKCDWTLLEPFILDHKKELSNVMVHSFLDASQTTKMMTYIIMVEKSTATNSGAKEYAQNLRDLIKSQKELDRIKNKKFHNHRHHNQKRYKKRGRK